MATLWVGSRKGLFRFDEGTAGWKGSAEPAFLAAPVTAILDDPRDGALTSGLPMAISAANSTARIIAGQAGPNSPPRPFPNLTPPTRPRSR